MRTQTSARLLRALAGCVLCAAPATRAQSPNNAGSRDAPELTKLVLRGVQHVDPVDLEKSISTQATTCKSLVIVPLCLIFNSHNLENRQYLDHEELAIDIKRILVYYWKRGYRDAEVDTIVAPSGPGQVAVTFDIREGLPTIIRRLEINYDSVLLRESRVRRLTTLKAGEAFDLVKLDSMRLGFLNEMWAEGHSDAAVDTVVALDTTRRMADVRLNLIPNHTTYVGDIVVEGLYKVSRAVVLNAITLRPGDKFRRTDVLESQRNLFESNLFGLGAVVVPPQFDSVKRIVITVTESPLHAWHGALGVTNIEFLQLDGNYTDFNLLGGARRLDIHGNVGNVFATQLAGRGFFLDPERDVPGGGAGKYLQPTWAASVDFRQPAFLHRPSDQLGLSAFAHRRSTPGIFIDRGYGGAVTLTNEVRIRAPLSLTYRYELNRVDAGDVYFCVNYGVCDTTTIMGLRSHQRLSPLSLTGFIDRSDDPLDPTRGYLARLDLEHASAVTLSDYSYNRAFVDIAAYDHRGYTSTYAAHVRLGWVRANGVLHPRKGMYAGGANSVRGYANNQLGPRVLAISADRLTDTLRAVHCTNAQIADASCDPNAPTDLRDYQFIPQPLGGTTLFEASVEYRFPIGLRRKLTGAVFLDGGVVGSGAVPTLDIRGKGAVTPGFGIRYKSPVGPIRVDIGINPARAEQLFVVTETIVNGERKIVQLTTPRLYSPAATLLQRMTLNFSIGQAY